MEFCYNTLLKYECTGRLRVAREGFNGLLTGPPTGIRAFTEELKAW
jgi:predicted sulfurtransferase